MGAPVPKVQLSKWQHSAAVLTCCWLLFTQVYLVMSVFTYAGFMVMEIVPHVNSDNAGFYSGWISAAMMLTRTMGSYFWGVFSDTYGRVAALQASLLSSAVISVLFGLSSTFGMALFCRLALGLVNNLFMIVRVCVTELAGGNKKLETDSMNFVLSTWAATTIVGPAVAGVVAEPVKQYPEVAWLQSGPLHSLFSAKPFLAPNLVACSFCLIASVLLATFVTETVPEERRRPVHCIPGDFAAATLRCFRKLLGYSQSPANEREVSGTTESSPLLQTTESSASSSSSSASPPSSASESEAPDSTAKETKTLSSLWANANLRAHIFVIWYFDFLFFAFDSVFPLYCLSQSAGLGVSEKYIGQALGMTSFLFIVIQLIGYGPAVERLGLYGTIRYVPMVTAPLVALMPITGILNRSAEGGWNTSTLIFVSVQLSAFHAACSTLHSSISVAINRLVPSTLLGALSGVQETGASIADMLGTFLAGFVAAAFFSNEALGPRFGSLMLWTCMAVLFGVGTAISFFFLKEGDGKGSGNGNGKGKGDGDEDEEVDGKQSNVSV